MRVGAPNSRYLPFPLLFVGCEELRQELPLPPPPPPPPLARGEEEGGGERERGGRERVGRVRLDSLPVYKSSTELTQLVPPTLFVETVVSKSSLHQYSCQFS